MTLANLYVLGAPKCGTTAVAAWLGGHRDVYWSIPKEPFHWAEDFAGQRAHYGFDRREAYAALFDTPEARSARYRGDASTTYLYSERAVPQILENVPDPRFVVCLRNPVDLVVSFHRTQLVALNEDEPDFAAAWRRSLEGRLPGCTPLDPKLVDYPMMGRVGAAMARLYELVPPEQVHVVLLDDLRSDPRSVWRGLAGDLGLDPDPEPVFEVRNASDKTYRHAGLRRLTHRPPAFLAPPVRRLRQWARTTDLGAVHALKRSMWRPTDRPSIDAGTRAELAEHFRPDVELLSQVLGRDLSAWSLVPAA